MSVEVEAQALLRELAAPAVPGGRVCAAIARAARHSGMSSARVTKLLYGNARAILAAEMDQLRERARKARGARDYGLRGEYENLYEGINELEDRLSALRQELARARADGSSAG